MFSIVKKYKEYAFIALGVVMIFIIVNIISEVYHYIVDPRVELERRDKVVEINKVRVDNINNILANSKANTERRLNEITIDSDINITDWVW